MTQPGPHPKPAMRITRNIRQSIITAALERLARDDAALDRLCNRQAATQDLVSWTEDVLREAGRSVGVRILPTAEGRQGVNPEIFMTTLGIGRVHDRAWLQNLILERLKDPSVERDEGCK